jgi:glycosyltransferase involved in cell wall biosynthesis
MCTFNGARYVREQVESLFRQTLLPDELVICDDRSTDGCRDLLQSLSAESPFTIRLIANEERLGAARNFEKAIGLCGGDIIFLADQDDVWCPTKLEVVADTLNRHPGAAYAFSDAAIIDEKGNSLGVGLWEMKGFSTQRLVKLFAGRQFELLLGENLVTGCAMAFRATFRRFFLPIGRWWIHDWWIALLGSVFSHGVPVPDRLLCYRKHPSQQVGIGWTTLLGRCRESLHTRKEDYWERLAGARELQDRVRYLAQTTECPRQHLAEIDQKTQHLALRLASQEASGTAKLRIVFEELLSGGYRRYSGSWRSVVRDLCPQFLLNWRSYS